MANLFETIRKQVSKGVEWMREKIDAISKSIQGWLERYKKYRKYREALRKHQEYIDSVVLDANMEYRPEEVDVQLGERLKQLIASLEGGRLLEHIKSLPLEERKAYFENEFLPKIAAEMDVETAFLGWFGDESTIGFYSEEKRGVALNELFLASDNEYILGFFINTVIHECKHAMQWDAVSGRNTHGYSEQLISVWRRNYEDYIQPRESDEGYVKQPVEWDANSFAEDVYPTDKK